MEGKLTRLCFRVCMDGMSMLRACKRLCRVLQECVGL